MRGRRHSFPKPILALRKELVEIWKDSKVNHEDIRGEEDLVSWQTLDNPSHQKIVWNDKGEGQFCVKCDRSTNRIHGDLELNNPRLGGQARKMNKAHTMQMACKAH
jgi:hypothetical protein